MYICLYNNNNNNNNNKYVKFILKTYLDIILI